MTTDPYEDRIVDRLKAAIPALEQLKRDCDEAIRAINACLTAPPQPTCGTCAHSPIVHPLRRITHPYTDQPDTTTSCKAIVNDERCDCPEYTEVYR